MLGAIAGDVIGSVYERQPIKTKEFPLLVRDCVFTDDSVLTAATADALLQGEGYADATLRWGRRHSNAGYGGSFFRWLLQDDPQPYGSWGNGAAMRVSPIGWAFDSAAEVLEQARRSAIISHDHPEGIKGAQAAALAVWLARTGRSKAEIRADITTRLGYDLDRSVDSIRPGYRFDVSCQGSVPEALVAFFDSDSYEDTVRNAISLGGDSDTLACIAGAVAEAFYGGVPEHIAQPVRTRLTPDLLAVVDAFAARFELPA